MAEVVVHKAFLSPVIQLICERLCSTNFRDYFHKGLVKKLQITLISISRVLDDAETKQYEKLYVKNWLDNVSNEIYEVEQLLDVIATDAQRKGKIQRFLSASINRFESRIKVLLKRLEFLADQRSYLGLQDATRGSNEDGATPQILPTISLVYESVIYGREREKEEIIEFLLSDSYDRVSIISVVGLMGMGKTTLAKLVYNDHRVAKQFELKAWVHVPKSFDFVSLTTSILRSFGSTEAHNQDLLQHQLQQLLMGKKYLLVLDCVWEIDENTWEKFLLFKYGSSGSKMIVTTHDKEVASSMSSARILHLKQLEESDSWSLFVRYAYEGRNVFEYPNLESIGKKIAEKCGGLPLALKTLGIFARRKFSAYEWVRILETDLWRFPEDDSNNFYSILRMSYLNLPSNLKRCFAYCSIFPKGYEFEKGELIKLWMAEGFFKHYRGDKSKKELGNEFFDRLVSLSFFQQSVIMPLWSGKYYFIMHDLVNDLAKSLSGESRLRIEGDNVQDIPQRTRHI